MPLVVKDRVQETTTTTGTGTYTLAGAVTGYQAFSVVGNGNTTYYAVSDGTSWEVGIGTYTLSGTTLSRDTILESSNSGNAVNWGAGTKNIFVTYPAERSVATDAANTFTANQVINVADNTNAALRITQTGTGNALVVEDSANPDSTPFVIDTNGRVVSGNTAVRVYAGGLVPQWQVEGADGATASLGVFRAGGSAPIIQMAGSNGTQTSPTVVAANNGLLRIRASGYDGASFIPAADIVSEVDGTPGTNDMPGRLVFSTTADGASSPTERLRITNFGGWGLAGANYGVSGTQAIVSNGNAAAPTWQDVVTPTATQTLTNKTLTDPAIIGAITEDIFTITDGAAFEVDPGNGTIQLITLGANRTPKATNFAAGESVTLMINDGTAYTITWTDATWGSGGVVWVGGVAPTLATTGYTVIEFWKVSTQVYGALVGSVA